jgi:hypothetical protein
MDVDSNDGTGTEPLNGETKPDPAKLQQAIIKQVRPNMDVIKQVRPHVNMDLHAIYKNGQIIAILHIIKI